MTITRASVPDHPHPSAADHRAYVESAIRLGLRFHQFVLEEDGEVVGFAEVTEIIGDESGLYGMEISVHPKTRARGIGAALWDRLLALKGELNYVRSVGWIFEGNDAAAKFAAKCGHEPNGSSEQSSRLIVSAARLDGFEDVEGQLADGGLRIEVLDRYASEDDFMRQVHRVDMDSHRDVPSSVPWKDVPYDEWLRFTVTGPGRSTKWAWVALDGNKPVGLARLRVYPEGKASNAYTGVLSAYRGRGVARALKYRTVAWSRENGIAEIYTNNEAKNTRMLGINLALGYEIMPKQIEVERRWET